MKRILLVVIFLFVFLGSCQKNEIEEIDFTYLEPKLITVYLKGDVKFPGVYKVSTYTSLKQLIYYAGGFLPTFDDSNVNYSITLYDELTLSFTNAFEYDNSTKININTATKEQLMELPGIGEVTAISIINYRISYGVFLSLEQLLEVTGIGEKKFNEIKNLITI